MISIIVYGRNDSHGYNFHKRAVLSLNGLAAVLTEPNDEIIFVDWNSPEGTPPMPVAVADLLTPEARQRIKVISVPRGLHENLARGVTSKVVLEPVARNVGIRRADQGNSWILSTNLDVILRVKGNSLSEIVRNLTHSYYACPRFELPEWLWESFDRLDPHAYFSQLDWLAQNTSLNQVVFGNAYGLYDAPGDFQLLRRDELEQIGAFDETMLLGWHVDSNLARRLSDAYGPPHSLASEISVYHCNHTRTATDHHRTFSQANSLEKYVTGRVGAVSRSGAHSWGLPEQDLQILTLTDLRSLTGPAIQLISSHKPISTISALSSESHALCGVPAANSLPFALDQIVSSSTPTELHYIGTRPDFGDVLREFARLHNSTAFQLFNRPKAQQSLPSRRLVVVDLTPPEAQHERRAQNLDDLSDLDKRALARAFLELDQEIATERVRSTPTKYLVVNGEYNTFATYLEPFFSLMPVQYYSRVRVGKLVPIESEFGGRIANALKGLAANSATSGLGIAQACYALLLSLSANCPRGIRRPAGILVRLTRINRLGHKLRPAITERARRLRHSGIRARGTTLPMELVSYIDYNPRS